MKRAGILLGYCLAFWSPATATAPPTPSFYARRDYTGLNSQSVVVADVNSDGIPDLITNNQSTFQVLLGIGNGNFHSGPATSTGLSAIIQFAAVDVNNDGKPDLVMSAGQGSQAGIAVCFGNGDGTFQAPAFYPAGGETAATIGGVVAASFSRNGWPQIATVGASGVWIFQGTPSGTFNSAVVSVVMTTGGGSGVAAADFNGDGNMDLVVTLPYGGSNGSGNGFVVLLGNGDGTFQQPQSFAQPKRPFAVVAGPVTQSAAPGIVVSGGSSAYVYYGNGAGGFSGPRAVNLPGMGTHLGSVALGDVNGDGLPDLVSATGFVAFGASGANFSSASSYAVDSSGTPYNVVLADLCNRGKMDIVTDSSAAVSVLLSMGKGRFEDGVWTAISSSASCGVTADFNRDGKPDLAVNTPSGVTILLGTGSTSALFTVGASIAVSSAVCLATGDLNGDAIPDLLVVTPTALVSYLGNGDGTFTQKSSTPVSYGSVVLADFNHDGKLDFATTGNLLGLGNGDGTFQTPVQLVSNPPPAGFAGIAAGDINNDGWPDLVLTNAISGSNLYVLLNNQKGGFTQSPTNFGSQTNQAVLTDLNCDGNLDLILSGMGYADASIYFGDGQGNFTYSTTLGSTTTQQAGFNLAADINGDGIPDIAIMSANTVAVYLGRGGGTYAPPFNIGLGPAPGTMLAANVHGQLPSVGLPDIVSPDYSGGVTVLLNLTSH